IGGEALPGEIADKFHATFDASLHNFYGPTETVVNATSYHVQGTQGTRIVPIGKPKINTQLHLLDDALQPVPAGVIGEIYLGGPPNDSSPTRSTRAGACIGPETWDGVTPTGTWSSSAGPTSRSRSVASESNWARSPPRSRWTRASARLWWSRRTCRHWAKAWWGT